MLWKLVGCLFGIFIKKTWIKNVVNKYLVDFKMLPKTFFVNDVTFAVLTNFLSNSIVVFCVVICFMYSKWYQCLDNSWLQQTLQFWSSCSIRLLWKNSQMSTKEWHSSYRSAWHVKVKFLIWYSTGVMVCCWLLLSGVQQAGTSATLLEQIDVVKSRFWSCVVSIWPFVCRGKWARPGDGCVLHSFTTHERVKVEFDAFL